jgi:hypothetical protein
MHAGGLGDNAGHLVGLYNLVGNMWDFGVYPSNSAAVNILPSKRFWYLTMLWRIEF